MRLQLALNVRDLDAAVAFYSKMFGAEVNKRKPGYANFAIDQPPLKLVLFELPDAPEERLNHLGVEVFDDDHVTRAATDRLRAAEDMDHAGRGRDHLLLCEGEQGLGPGARRAALGVVPGARRLGDLRGRPGLRDRAGARVGPGLTGADRLLLTGPHRPRGHDGTAADPGCRASPVPSPPRCRSNSAPQAWKKPVRVIPPAASARRWPNATTSVAPA